MSILEIYTDGGCHGNPGPGAWAFIIVLDNSVVERAGYREQTTNNRMELQAVIEALGYVEHHYAAVDITVNTDSQYVKNGISQWILRWEKNGWKTAGKKPVKNKDLWVRLKRLTDRLHPKWNWVKGHAGNKYNEKCDKLVQESIKNRKN